MEGQTQHDEQRLHVHFANLQYAAAASILARCLSHVEYDFEILLFPATSFSALGHRLLDPDAEPRFLKRRIQRRFLHLSGDLTSTESRHPAMLMSIANSH